MQLTVTSRPVRELAPLHNLYQAEANCQIVRDSFWSRGFLDAWAVEVNGRLAGYGATANRYDAGRLLEFYVLPAYRSHAPAMCRSVIAASQATHMEAQSNIPLTHLLLHDCATEIRAEKVLFADACTTHLASPEGVVFRRRSDANESPVFEHRHEPIGDWVIELRGEIVATGGFLTHYNPPYADLYMEVAEPSRRRGIGSYLIQELKRVCYESGHRPAARCDMKNHASRNTLEKAGLLACGHVLVGSVKQADSQEE